jgi:osmotically-inducible protein OsmY
MMTQDSYQAFDDVLRAEILAKFATEDPTAFNGLRVGVQNGIAHLAGVVSSLEIRLAAAELVEGVPGVRGVVNRIDAPGAPSPGRTVNLNLKNKKTKSGN